MFRFVSGLVLLAFLQGPVLAQSPGDFLGAFGAIVRLSQEQQHKKRSEYSAVRRMQAALRNLGYYSGNVDGKIGPQTLDAIAAYYRTVGRSLPAQLSMDDVTFLEQQARETPVPMPTAYATAELAKPYSPISSPTSWRELAPLQISPEFRFKKGADGVWIVVASGADRDNVVSVASSYLQDFPSTLVVRSGNGRYAILLGWSAKARAADLKKALQGRAIIPDDTYMAAGESFGSPVWTSDARNISSRIDLLQYGLLRMSPEMLMVARSEADTSNTLSKLSGQIGGLSDPLNGYVSLYKEPSEESASIRRLPADTVLQVQDSRGDWLKVLLLNGMSGWVQSRYVATENSPVVDSDEEDLEESDAPPLPGASKSSVAIDQARIDRITADARSLIDDVDVFLKKNPDTPDIVAVASSMTELQSALEKGDIAAVEAASSNLNRQLLQAPDYILFKQERQKLREEAEVAALGEAVSLAKRNSFLMTRFAAQNVKSPSLPAFVPLMKEYEKAIAQKLPSLEHLTKLNTRFEETRNAQNLVREFEELAEACGEKCGQSNPEIADDAQTVIQVTERNKVILQGEEGDFIVLYNASSAPNVVRNLRGEFVFDDGKASACYLHQTPDKETDNAALKLLNQLGAKHVGSIASPCQEMNLRQYDLVVGKRSDILKQKADYIYPLWGLLERGTYQTLTVVPSLEFAALSSSGGALAVSIERALRGGLKLGFGLLRVGSSSSVICMTTPSSVEGHRLALEGRAADLSLYARNYELKTVVDVDDAFLRIKKGQCGVVYGGAQELGIVINALERDGMTFNVLPIWFEQADIDNAQTKAEQLKQVAAQTEVEEKRKREDAELLAKKRAAELAASKIELEKKLRAEHGATARARANEILAQFDLLQKSQNNWFDETFPDTAKWYQGQQTDGWQFVQSEVEIADFGNSLWKERTLAAVSVDLKVSMKNAMLGENKTYCFNLGVIFDDEYQVVREAVEAPCDKAEVTASKWKSGWGFKSLWMAGN